VFGSIGLLGCGGSCVGCATATRQFFRVGCHPERREGSRCPGRVLRKGGSVYAALTSSTEGSFYMSDMSSILGIALYRDALSHHELQ